MEVRWGANGRGEKPATRIERRGGGVEGVGFAVGSCVMRPPLDAYKLTPRYPLFHPLPRHRHSFNVFEVEKESTNGSLVWVAEALVKKCGLEQKLKVNRVNLRGWLIGVQEGYTGESVTPYHNSMHGADVCQTVYCLIENSYASKLISDNMKYIALLAAACHDCGHGGFNNNFLVNTNDQLAIIYSYDAPLERMHAAKGFEIMREKDCDAFCVFDGEELRKARKFFASFILATDMADHFAHVGQLTKQLESVGVDLTKESDACFTLGMVLHAADVSNPTKSWDYYNLWTDRVMKEFFDQGRKEKELSEEAAAYSRR